MNKLLITAILILTSITSIPSARAEEGLYLKLAAGLNHINKSYHKDSLYSGELKLKRFFPVIGLGVGYEFEDNLRIETMIDYYFLFSQRERSKHHVHNADFHLNLDTKISDLVVNVYKGYRTNDKLLHFVGIGAGISSIQNEGTGFMQQDGLHTVLAPAYGKHVYRPTYRFMVGTSYELNKGIKCELSYNYLMLGKNKPQKVEEVDNILKRNFNVHNTTLGIRFSL
jgi:opacity protein-like surface antigen